MAKELWTPPENVTLLGKFPEYLPRERIVTLPSGERVGVKIDDSGTVKHIHHDHTLDAVVRPKTIKIKVRKVADER